MADDSVVTSTIDDFENVDQIGDVNDHLIPKSQGFKIVEKLPTEVRDLIYWRCPLKTGIVFSCVVILLISFLFLSVIAVVAYAFLSLLCCTFAYRLYCDILANIRKNETDQHPFQCILDKDLTLPTDKIADNLGKLSVKLNTHLCRIRDVIFVNNYIDSIKMVIALYIMTIVGGWFNLTTLIFICVINIFTIPKIYELYHEKIDEVFNLVAGHVKIIWEQVRAKIETLPVIGKKKTN